MIWESPDASKYPGVRAFALRMKSAIMSAHDAVLSARVKQTYEANKHRRECPLEKGDLVYVSTKNISLPKGTARKLTPKYIGPYRIIDDYRNNSYKLDLPPRLKQRGVHPVFHSSLLRIHIPNDDRLFPGRVETQVAEFDETASEWAIDKILSHSGARSDAKFEISWKSGDTTWLPYDQVADLDVLKDYFALLGIESVSELPDGAGPPESRDPHVFIGHITFELPDPIYTPPKPPTTTFFHSTMS